MIGLVQASVRVQARNHHVDEEEVEHHGRETEDVNPRGLGITPTRGRASVQVQSVDNPGDQSRGLLRIPAPVAAPCGLRPNSAENNAQTEQREGSNSGAVGNRIQLLCIRQRRDQLA